MNQIKKTKKFIIYYCNNILLKMRNFITTTNKKIRKNISLFRHRFIIKFTVISLSFVIRLTTTVFINFNVI